MPESACISAPATCVGQSPLRVKLTNSARCSSISAKAAIAHARSSQRGRYRDVPSSRRVRTGRCERQAAAGNQGDLPVLGLLLPVHGAAERRPHRYSGRGRVAVSSMPAAPSNKLGAICRLLGTEPLATVRGDPIASGPFPAPRGGSHAATAYGRTSAASRSIAVALSASASPRCLNPVQSARASVLS